MEAEQVVVGVGPGHGGVVVGHAARLGALSRNELDSLQGRVRTSEPGKDQAPGGPEEPHSKLLQGGVGDLCDLEDINDVFMDIS